MTSYLLAALAPSSLLNAACVGAWAWVAFTLPYLHHDVWTMRHPRNTALSQSSELIGGVLQAVVLYAIGQ